MKIQFEWSIEKDDKQYTAWVKADVGYTKSKFVIFDHEIHWDGETPPLTPEDFSLLDDLAYQEYDDVLSRSFYDKEDEYVDEKLAKRGKPHKG